MDNKKEQENNSVKYQSVSDLPAFTKTVPQKSNRTKEREDFPMDTFCKTRLTPEQQNLLDKKDKQTKYALLIYSSLFIVSTICSILTCDGPDQYIPFMAEMAFVFAFLGLFTVMAIDIHGPINTYGLWYKEIDKRIESKYKNDQEAYNQALYEYDKQNGIVVKRKDFNGQHLTLCRYFKYPDGSLCTLLNANYFPVEAKDEHRFITQ